MFESRPPVGAGRCSVGRLRGPTAVAGELPCPQGSNPFWFSPPSAGENGRRGQWSGLGVVKPVGVGRAKVPSGWVETPGDRPKNRRMNLMKGRIISVNSLMNLMKLRVNLMNRLVNRRRRHMSLVIKRRVDHMNRLANHMDRLMKLMDRFMGRRMDLMNRRMNRRMKLMNRLMNLMNLCVRVNSKCMCVLLGDIPGEILCHEVRLIVGRSNLLDDDLTIHDEFLPEEELEVDVL